MNKFEQSAGVGELKQSFGLTFDIGSRPPLEQAYWNQLMKQLANFGCHNVDEINEKAIELRKNNDIYSLRDLLSLVKALEIYLKDREVDLVFVDEYNNQLVEVGEKKILRCEYDALENIFNEISSNLIAEKEKHPERGMRSFTREDFFNQLTTVSERGHVIKLDLYELLLKKIPLGVGKLVGLKELSLHGNLLEQITGLENLQALEKLFLSRNLLSRINGLDSLKNLKELHVSLGVLEDLTGLEGLENLEILSAAYNQITKVSGLDNLKKLKKLNLRKNLIDEVDSLEQLASLEFVDLVENSLDPKNPLPAIVEARRRGVEIQMQ